MPRDHRAAAHGAPSLMVFLWEAAAVRMHLLLHRKRGGSAHADAKWVSLFPSWPHELTFVLWKTWMTSGFLASCCASVPVLSSLSCSPVLSRICAAAACCPAHAACRAERPFPSFAWMLAPRDSSVWMVHMCPSCSGEHRHVGYLFSKTSTVPLH